MPRGPPPRPPPPHTPGGGRGGPPGAKVGWGPVSPPGFGAPLFCPLPTAKKTVCAPGGATRPRCGGTGGPQKKGTPPTNTGGANRGRGKGGAGVPGAPPAFHLGSGDPSPLPAGGWGRGRGGAPPFVKGKKRPPREGGPDLGVRGGGGPWCWPKGRGQTPPTGGTHVWGGGKGGGASWGCGPRENSPPHGGRT